jgi:aspartyl-tRNA(Asn)/glutamyl-tRNA(Gln) amidotransferase subunit A
LIDRARLDANRPLNAFVEWDWTASAGEGPLADLTVGVKANIAVRGFDWNAGMELHRGRKAGLDAEVVARLRMAGARIIGTLNMDEAALGAKTDNPWFGDTINPHRAGYTPGGSSGGSGAAVAAGLCDVALGTDTMGSIRKPASYCGVYGFKPAGTSVGQSGVIACEPSLDAVGPLARDLGTLERVWDVIKTPLPFRGGAGGGNSPRFPSPTSESVESPHPNPSPEGEGLAILQDLGGVECSPDVLAAYEQAKAALGVMVEIALPHPLSRARYAGFVMTARALSEQFANADPALLSERFKRLIAYGPRRSDADWGEDQRVIADTAEAFRAAVATHGAILTPTSPAPAFPHSEDAPANQADLTAPANFADLPAISIPGGWSDGLPFGMQLIGRTGDEAGLFALARKLDSALNAYRRPPHFHEGEAP